MALLHTVTELSRKRHEDPVIVRYLDFQQQAAVLEQQLEDLYQYVDSNEDHTLRATAELKRKAALLYLHCALYDATPDTLLIQQGVTQILNGMAGLLDTGAKNGLIWPLFVAAVEVQPGHTVRFLKDGETTSLHGQAFVLHALDRLSDTLTNVGRTRSVILEIWKAREDRDEYSLSDSGNDWEHFVAPRCGNMSLV